MLNTGTLTLVSVEYGYLVVEDSDGDEILTTPGPVFQTVYLREDYDLQSAWFAAVTDHRNNPPDRWSYRPDRTLFAVKVLQEIAEPDDLNIVWCENCEDPQWEDETQTVGRYDDTHVCTSCFEENYRSCDDCGTVVHYENTYYTLSDENVCERCQSNNYSYCEDCDGYYPDHDSSEHQHGGCDCEPPTLALAMRNAEGTTLSADERLVFSLPSGVISEEGIYSIVRLIREQYYQAPETDDHDERVKWWNLSYEVHTLDSQWQTKEGNFTKRLSKLAHKTQGLKIPPALLTKVGNVARDNSSGAEVNVELTRNLNLPAEDFYHEDSCWWQSYAESRCALKSNGGIGMRTFSAGPYGDHVAGRAWIMPLRADEDGNLSATFDAETADAYVVFNGYGDLSGYTPARIVSGMVGMTYSKISFDCNPMYINNSSGYLVASQEIIAKHAGGLSLDVDTHSRLYHSEVATAARQLVNA